jgi:hypothetical protein
MNSLTAAAHLADIRAKNVMPVVVRQKPPDDKTVHHVLSGWHPISRVAAAVIGNMQFEDYMHCLHAGHFLVPGEHNRGAFQGFGYVVPFTPVQTLIQSKQCGTGRER